MKLLSYFSKKLVGIDSPCVLENLTNMYTANAETNIVV
jgi:hypothetical protein